MRDSTASPSVMIISDDVDLVATLVRNNKTDQEFISHPSINFVLDDPSLLDNNSILIFDIASNGNRIESTIDQVLRLKQLAPTQILILTGIADPLGNVLKTKIQPLVFRAFTKPVSANQVFLAFKSGNKLHDDLVQKQAAGIDITAVGPVENRTNVDSLMGERKTGSALIAGVALLLIAGAAWFLLVDRSEQPVEVTNTRQTPAPTPVLTPSPDLTPIPEPSVALPTSVETINQLNQLAATALQEDRVIEPRGHSALDYYNQTLVIDPYDSTAYQGKKSISDRLRSSYSQLVTAAEFDQAFLVINALEQLEPLNLDNDKLRTNLEKAIDSHVKKIQKSGSSKQIAETTAVLKKIESDFSGSKSASDALQAEKTLISKIDAALDQDLLIPPQAGNAYSLVSASLKANTVSNANITPRVKGLSTNLLSKATASTEQGKLDEARQLATLIKRLNVDRQGLNTLNTLIDQRAAAIAAASKAAVAEVAAPPEPPKIIPAKIITRAPPRYPQRALARSIEGWVEVGFQVSNEGVPINVAVLNSEPTGIFESSALKAVKRWRFSPARNEENGLPVLGETITTKVSFKLE